MLVCFILRNAILSPLTFVRTSDWSPTQTCDLRRPDDASICMPDIPGLDLPLPSSERTSCPADESTRSYSTARSVPSLKIPELSPMPIEGSPGQPHDLAVPANTGPPTPGITGGRAVERIRTPVKLETAYPCTRNRSSTRVTQLSTHNRQRPSDRD